MKKTTKWNAPLTGVIALGMIFATGANADCGGAARGLMKTAAVWQDPVPLLAGVTLQPVSPSPTDANVSDRSITGLWKTVFVSGGAIVDIGFDLWHSDGTEMLADAPPPAAGNICVGTFEKVGPRTYALVHPAFNWDPTGVTVVSIFIQRMRVTVSDDGNSYSGAFSADSYDFQGNLLPGSHAAGAVTGTRIQVGTPFPFPFPFPLG